MVENESDICWRKEIDENLKRLHSLLFGIDLALERKDSTSAQILSLRLLGFLDSRINNETDEVFISPIRQEVTSKLEIARRSLVSESDRLVFQQARRDPGTVFLKRGEIDIEKVKQSKYFRGLCHTTKGNAVDNSIFNPPVDVDLSGVHGSRTGDAHHLSQPGQLDRQNDRPSSKTSKVMTQAKLTSLYGSKPSKPNSGFYKSMQSSKSNTEDCHVVKKTLTHNQNVHKTHGVSAFLQVEDEEKPHENYLTTKRAHSGVSSPKNENAKSPACSEDTEISINAFVTARMKLEMDARQKRGLAGSPSASISPQNDSNINNRGYGMRSGGYSRRGARNNFVAPFRSNGSNTGHMTSRNSGKGDDALDDSTKRCLEILCGPDGELPEKLRNLEPRLIEHVSNEIMDRDPNVRWADIAGLDHAKKCVTEMVIWPLLRPDIFKGCRSPGRGLLLFGPPGTGKTMIGKAIAGEAKATFFYISASSLTSKWIGEGEKLVRALFGVASCRQPAVIFVDEIDSLLSQRKSEGEHESSRRLKTQFLIEMEGFDSGSEQILLIGATNRPQELDEAARRRLTKRLYIPLPSSEARAWIIRRILEKDGLFDLSEEEIDAICKLTEGYSGSDMNNLVKDASLGPLRDATKGVNIANLKNEDMRSVTLQDFENALQEVRPSVSSNELGTYEEWNKQFGSLAL
ncbi:hypothetical protein AQUCO_01100188v1 [Aquilegia coerulea]|uniref:AAA+ ATPase domain-containing protein n=1 Tax=Aquilegia coerulea TaxID=218851 RepID=A0A2G5E5Y4_AQUCA|nr:hypothetical protein AQUCO_01100188v1 [Aquilegia coerulea]